MTFTAPATIGFPEMRNLPDGGPGFTMGIFVMSIGTIPYIASQTATPMMKCERLRLTAVKKQLRNMEERYSTAGGSHIVAGNTEHSREEGCDDCLLSPETAFTRRLYRTL